MLAPAADAPAGSELVAWCAELVRVLARLPRLEQQLHDACDLCGRLQEAVHAADNRIGELVERVEAAPATTAAEADAKRAVAEALEALAA